MREDPDVEGAEIVRRQMSEMRRTAARNLDE
jgi:hypothetical protein